MDSTVKSMEKRNKNGRVAIMQPYFFPYLGYFHLIESSDRFVFYDDVNFIKGGWINRNRILNQGKARLVSIPVADAGSNRLIHETVPADGLKWRDYFFKTLQCAYGRAPFFKTVKEVALEPFEKGDFSIADIAVSSIKAVYAYLGISFSYDRSSFWDDQEAVRNQAGASRVMSIVKKLGYKEYVNLPSGESLYNKEFFKAQGVGLTFVRNCSDIYRQFGNRFTPNLSIVDVLMFCGREKTIELFSQYSLDKGVWEPQLSKNSK